MSLETDLQRWLQPAEPPWLGPTARPNVSSEAALAKQFATDPALQRLRAQTRRLAEATILIWSDHLESAHRVVQEIETAEGAYLHGVVHRREPDFWNAKYWFRRASRASVNAAMAAPSESEARDPSVEAWSSRVFPGGRWEPLAFVDACEAAQALPESAPLVRWARSLQARELETCLRLFLASP